MILSILVKHEKSFQEKFTNRATFKYHQSGTNGFSIAISDSTLLQELKNDPNVLFIDCHQKIKEEASVTHTNPAFNRISKAYALFPDVTGFTQKISIKEQSFDTTDIDLKNRSFKTSVSPATSSQHATAMATLIAGGENSSWRARGVAPQARFTASDFSNLFPDNISIFNSNYIHLQNHSYGVGIENYYGNEAVAYDEQVFQNPTLLHVFSAGNSGQLQPTTGTYANMTFANLTGNFKQAKNVLVVNAVDSTLIVNTLNSRGPAFDGRLKPELTTYGQGGTSEASALVSGVSALVYEKYFKSKGETPDASMTKAILIASSDDIGSHGIDYLTGYGSVNAYKALQLIEQDQSKKVTLASGDQISVPINIPSSVSEIKIAVAWNDPPATVNANSVLINDIDAWLYDGTTKTLPWVLSTYPNPDSLQALAKRKSDHINNVEFITLKNPPSGAYQLFLKSGTLTTASQNVSVAYWLNKQDQFEWDFPVASQVVEGGSKSLLVWEATSGQTGDLYLQLNSENWQLTQSGINLDNYFYWTPPNVLAKAKLKMVIDGVDFQSGDFLISPSLKLKTAFNCTDSLGLSWSKVPGASQYEIYSLGDQYLAKRSTTVDTILILPQSFGKFFAVAPVFNGVTGSKSETIDFTQQGAFCYLNLFSAERLNLTTVHVQLSLSSWYDVDHVTILKNSNMGQTIFKTLSPANTHQFDFSDEELISGIMTYQAEIFFKNGMTVFSELIKIPIEPKGKALVYPNPVSSGSDLNIISEGKGLTFRVLDIFGRPVLEKELQYFEDAADVVNLPAGLYVYQLMNGDIVRDTGRFVKY
ncbi:hypothetical protein WSM22_05450 [Cytophagales bacterium WSM2-2]|nr:hypothetical protein WSM22_05450 [Cytophagales bacterium WSM2-2]